MGRLLNEKEIINKNIESYLTKSTSEYTKFLESTPSFVTYYSKATIQSTVDEGLEDSHNLIGKASSKKYKKIKDLPLYGVDTIQLEIQKEEWGAQTSYDGSCIMLPNTIKPLPFDYFSFSYIGKIYLFRINNVINDKLNGKNFYKIEFSFNKILSSESEIDMQISGVYETIYENIGTREKCIIEHDEKLTIDYIEKIEEKLIDTYNEFFLDKKFNLHLFKDMNVFLYNQMSTNFITNNKVFSRKKEFNNSVFIIDSLPKTSVYFSSYKESIFYAIEKRNHSHLNTKNICNKIKIITYPHTPFSMYSNKIYCNVTPYEPLEIDEEIEEPDTILFYDKDFIDRIKKNNPYRNKAIELYNNKEDDYIFEDIIIYFLNNNGDEVEFINNEILDVLNSYYYTPDKKTFYFLPIIIFILKYYKENLLSKINL